MKHFLVVAVLALFQTWSAIVLAQSSPTFETAWSVGPAKRTRLVAMGTDEVGSQYYAGMITSMADLDPDTSMQTFWVNGDADIVVYKLDSNQHWVWGRQMGSTAQERVSHLEVDHHRRVAVAGPVTTTFDIDPGPGQSTLSTTLGHRSYVLRLDPNGDFMWACPLKSTGSLSVSDVAFDKNDNLYVFGNFRGKADLDPGPDTLHFTAGDQYGDMFVLKINLLGQMVWARQLSGTGADDATSIFVDERSDVFLSGSYKGSIDLDPGAGQALHVSQGGSDVFLCKLDVNGQYVWGRSMGNQNNDGGLGLQVRHDGVLHVFGKCLDAVDVDPGAGVSMVGGLGVEGMYLVMLDDQLAVLDAKFWTIRHQDVRPNCWEVFDDGSLQFAGTLTQALDLDPGGGSFVLAPMGLEDAFLMILAPGGQFLWAGQFGGLNGYEHPAATTMDAFGNVYLLGEFQDSSDFDPGSGTFLLYGGLYFNGFVVKLHRSYSQSTGLAPVAEALPLWPNPGQGRFSMRLPEGCTLMDLQVLNALGQRVPARVQGSNGPIVVELEVPPGPYWVQATTDLGTWRALWVHR